MNYVIAGKSVDKDFECPICGDTLTAERLDQTCNPQMYSERGELAFAPYSPMDCTTEVVFRCRNCGSTVEITIPDYALAITDKEPTTPYWEYVIMSVRTVKYGRVKNLGNYESERFEAEIELEEGQTPDDAVIEAKAFVKRQLGLGPSNEDLEAARQLLAEAGEL